MAETGSIVGGKYEILKETGRGGMSVVYLAMDRHLNKQWAVKEILKKADGRDDEIAVNSLLAEANLMKRLDHPALPRIVDIIENETSIYIVMDYIEGRSLDRVLMEYGPQPEEKVIGWAAQLCDALSYLHHQKPPIIYRDMKPGNVMLKPDGTVKIIDFGIAREYKEQNIKDTTVLGTKGYAPPEQYSGQTDARSDIYALGMTMHHLLTGEDPRKGAAYASVRSWNPALSEGIELIIDRCVQPVPDNRYQTCEDLMYDLQHPDIITGDYKRRQKRKVLYFGAAAGLSAFFLVSGLILRTAGINQNDRTYESYVTTTPAADTDIRLEMYGRAIAIYPSRTEAYLKMLEAFEESGKFSKEENDRFLAVYNANKDKFDLTDPSTGILNYEIGLMYFNYYTNEDGSTDFAARVQKAYSFFEANHENNSLTGDFSYKNISDCYYHICLFYKKYILQSASVEEASQRDYNSLILTAADLMADVGKIPDANAYDKLAVYSSVFNLIYDQRTDLASAGVDQDAVLGLLSDVYETASALDVKKEQAQRLRIEIIDNYENYYDAVRRAYVNSGERLLIQQASDGERT